MLFSALKWESVITAPLYLEDLTHLELQWKQYTHWKNLNECCVYLYLRECEDEYGPKFSVRYVGEGSPRRVASKGHRVPVPSDNQYIFVVDGLTKKEVRDIEEKIIKIFGRIARGTGILENIKHKCGGQEDPIPPRKKMRCRYCEKMYAHIGFHEAHCKKNPQFTKRKHYEYEYKNCQYCGKSFTKNQVGQHERCCPYNPDPKPSSHKILKCKFCEKESLSSAMPQHERTCAKNPDRVPGPGTGEKFPKIQCSMCDKMVASNNIAIHERSCPNNPNRVPGVRAGKSSKKINILAE